MAAGGAGVHLGSKRPLQASLVERVRGGAEKEDKVITQDVVLGM